MSLAPEQGVLMHRKEVAKKLSSKDYGYIARQHETVSSYFLTLGSAHVDKDKFKGLILLNPAQNIVFGTSAIKIIEFRKLVMECKGRNEWVRLEGVPGPPSDNRIAVDFCVDSSGRVEPRIVCKIEGKEPIWIDGYVENLNCQEPNYRWEEIESFLGNLGIYCSNNEDTKRTGQNVVNGYLPCKRDIELAESQLRQYSDNNGMEAVLGQIELNYKTANKALDKNWREITKQNIKIWFSNNAGGSDAA